MSGMNNNCHVSNKWEDTGGNNTECDAAVLLNTDSNISLQELIENELALRNGATKNGVDSPKMLICDIDDAEKSELLILKEKLTLENLNNCSNSMKSKTHSVTEVDDFDVLYNEELENSANETVVNGHASIIHSFETTGSVLTSLNSFEIIQEEQKCVIQNQNELNSNSFEDCQSPSAKTNSVASDSLENQVIGDTALSSLSTTADGGDDDNLTLCNDDTNHVDISCVVGNSTNNNNTDFIPVSQINIIDIKDIHISESVNSEQECLPGYENVLQSASTEDDEWVCVKDATTLDENDEKISIVNDAIVLEHDLDTLEQECVNQKTHVTVSNSIDIGDDSCEASANAEKSSLNEEEKCKLVDTKYTKNVFSCEVVDVTLTSFDLNEPVTEIDSSAQVINENTPQCNDWRDEQYNEADVLVLNTKENDDYFPYVDKTEDYESKDIRKCVNLSLDDSFDTCTQLSPVMSAEKYIIHKSESKLIEECCYDLTQCSVDVVSESTVAEKKSVKKKKSTSEELVTTGKMKKTKKTKKYEEKENISVINVLPQNNVDDLNFHQIIDDGDELSNVCVRDLVLVVRQHASANIINKERYSNLNEQTNKTKDNKLSQYEEPVPASIPIKELTRSFGDLRVVSSSDVSTQINNSKSVSMSDLSYMDGKSFRMKKTVRELATSFENIFLTRSYGSSNAQKSGFGKFDQLTKKTMVHVRSSDSSKAQQQFNQNDASHDSGSVCKACNKNVFAMEQIKAERHVWHKNCFRCKTCNKQLTVDVYSSHEGELFCKPHFRDLFKPKIIVEEEKPVKFRKPELIIRENQPMDLPPDVVRASDKPDLGLEELSSLNVKSRFQVFEKPLIEDSTDKSPVCVKRSPSILSKLAKFQAKGMDVGVPSDIFNGIDYEESSSSEEELAQNENVTKNSVTKEKPIAFNKMNDVKKNWENGQTARREERQEERRQERQNIRSRLFMGKQNKMKEAYENAVAESERGNVKKDVEVKSDKARTIKEKFEKGEIIHDEESDDEQEKKANAKNDDMDVFEAGISKKSRSIFQQMDAAIKTQSNNNSFSPPSHPTQNGYRFHKEAITRQVSNDVVRASDPVEEVTVETADISSKFKFFETYKAPEVKRRTFRITPPREGQLKSESPEKEISKNPDVIRCEDQTDNENEVLKKSNTASKMLSLFRQLEEAQDVVPDGPKPMKKFTPPPVSSSGSEAESEDESEVSSESSVVLDDVVRSCDKTEDEYLKTAQKAAKAKALKEKFEKWEPEKQSNNNAVNLLDSEQSSLDTTKSLRARFESMKAEQPHDKPRPKVNRFVDKSLPGYCDTCFKKVYPLEKVEAGDKVFHRSCFKCTRCNGILRMETFTMNNGHLYCVPHFKQLFITKGNYDEGFGNDQHKAKWSAHMGVAMINGTH